MRLRPWWPVIALVVIVFIAVEAILAYGAYYPDQDSSLHTQIGFSFSPEVARSMGEDPVSSLGTLLTDLHPAVVRLPIYWEAAAPTPASLDWSSADALVNTVLAYDQSSPLHPTRMLLVVGARNLASPELHIPAWEDSLRSDLPALLSSAPFLAYLQGAVERYRNLPQLAGWQVENEPFDEVALKGEPDDALTVTEVNQEIALVHRLDPHHQVVETSYDSSNVRLDRAQASPFWALTTLVGPQPTGHMEDALNTGQVVGMDAYVVTPNTNLSAITAAQRIGWKSQSIAFWRDQAQAAGKALWLTEMQASPWNGMGGFTIADFQLSAREYARDGAAVILLWGVEYWLTHPAWLQAGIGVVAQMEA